MDNVELFIDDENEYSGIDAISVVENPAIEEDFVALKNQNLPRQVTGRVPISRIASSSTRPTMLMRPSES